MDPFEKFYANDEDIVEQVYNEFDNPEYQLLNIISTVPPGKWKLPAMYKIGARGEDRYYQIGFDGENLVTIYNQVGGKSQTSRNKVELNSRSINLAEQAMIRARNLFREYYRKNYRPRGSTVPRIKEPMLGYPLTDNVKLSFPVALELKLDGVRALFEMENIEVRARSRGGKYYTQFEHICKFMKELFSYLPAGTILDTEIYCHGFRIQDISGTARTINIKTSFSEKLLAYIFDAVLPGNPYYEERKILIKQTFQEYLNDYQYQLEQLPIRILEYQVAYNNDEILTFHQQAVEAGYEGTVIKRMAAGCKDKSMSQYKEGRSTHFYKLKNEETEEGIILEVLDCNGREKGCARFSVVDPRGNIFTVRPEGSLDYRRKLFQLSSNLVGKLFTYKMIGLTNHGVPNHPVGLAVRYDLDEKVEIAKLRKEIALTGKCICHYLDDTCRCEYWKTQ